MTNMYMRLFFALIISMTNVYLSADENVKWKYIPNYPSSVKFVECNEYILFDETIGNKKNEKNVLDEDEEWMTLNQKEVKALANFMNKNIDYKYKGPHIIGRIEVYFARNYKFIEINDDLKPRTLHLPRFVFAIRKDLVAIKRFRMFEGESQPPKFGIIVTEEKKLNELIKDWKINVDNPMLALDIAKLILLLDQYNHANILWEKKDVLAVMNKHLPSDLIKKRQLNAIEQKIQPPMYYFHKNYYMVRFITYRYYESNKIFQLNFWKFKVEQNGEISSQACFFSEVVLGEDFKVNGCDCDEGRSW